MKRLIPLALMLAAVFSSCDERPKDVMSKEKMENVLYDYHLMQGMIEQLPSAERERKAQDYINAVYKKHNISYADLERSLVYYNRHQKEMNSIYGKVKDRLTQENDELQAMNGNNSMMAVFANGGDTTNLWSTTKVLALRNKSLLNKESFTIKADTSFHKHDQFILTFTPSIIGEETEDYRVHLDYGLSVMYTNGKHIGVTRSVRNGSAQQISIEATDDAAIKNVSGFFYFTGKKDARTICIVDGIQLVRMHAKKEEPEQTDSVKTDSIIKDSVPARPEEERLSPEQLRMMNKSDKQIKIQEAPAMRHPNTIGPRRRVTRPVSMGQTKPLKQTDVK